MIQVLIDRFLDKKHLLAEKLTTHPVNYKTLVKMVVELISTEDDYDELALDPERVHEIDDGSYQGTLIYVIGAKSYQPSEYWYTRVDYGSCSGCDTLQGISQYSDEPPSPEQIKEYELLALHIVEGIKSMQVER